MRITYAMLEDQLPDCEVIRFYQEESPFFYNAKLLTNNSTAFEKHILYVASANQLQERNVSLPIPEELLCIGYLSYTTAHSYISRCNLLQISTEKTLDAFFSSLLSIIARFHQWADRLANAIIDKRDCFLFLDVAHDMLGNPLWIVDNSQCLIAYTRKDQCEDTAWQKTIKNGYIYVNETAIKERSQIGDQVNGNHVPVLFRLSSFRDPFLITNIEADGKSVAKLNETAVHHLITDGHTDLCIHLAKLLEIEFLRRKINSSREEHTYQRLLFQLIETEDFDEYRIRNQLEAIDWEPNKYFALMIVHCQNVFPSDQTLRNLNEQLSVVLPQCISIVHHGNLVCLLNSNQPEPLSERQRSKLNEFLSSYHLHAGVSETYQRLSMTFREYMLVKQVLSIAINDYGTEWLHHYHDYAFLAIRNILAEKSPLERYCFKGFLDLLEYDKQNESKLADTLYLYLKHNQSPSETAKALFIHKSTLDYRLRKIESIAGIDLHNSEDIFVMNLSYHLLNYNDYLREKSMR